MSKEAEKFFQLAVHPLPYKAEFTIRGEEHDFYSIMQSYAEHYHREQLLKEKMQEDEKDGIYECPCQNKDACNCSKVCMLAHKPIK